MKSNYTSINLINEIYKESFNVDIGLNELNLTDLIINHNESNLNQKPSLNRAKNNFSKIVLTNHYSAIANLPNETDDPVFYKLKYYRDYNSPGRRQDFIYPDLFQTGDILIYTNYFDYNYKYNFSYTYETGEYAYIYIDGKFVGNNPGLDENINRRNEFTAQYYKENNLTLLKGDYDKNDSKWLELANLQTLFAKNYYVILRPSLDYNFTIQCEAGKYLSEKGICYRCLPGQISSKGALKCENCPAGTEEHYNGTKCLRCPLGFHSGEGWNHCLSCTEEKYYDKDNRQCRKCPENYYLEEVTYECKKCPNGTLVLVKNVSQVNIFHIQMAGAHIVLEVLILIQMQLNALIVLQELILSLIHLLVLHVQLDYFHQNHQKHVLLAQQEVLLKPIQVLVLHVNQEHIQKNILINAVIAKKVLILIKVHLNVLNVLQGNIFLMENV